MTNTFDQLIAQIQSGDASRRSQAILSLLPQKFDDAQAISALVDVLRTDGDLNVVEDATWVLVQYGSQATPALLTHLTDDDPKIRHNISHALGKIADPQAISGLISATHDHVTSVRLKAVYALGQIGEPQAIPAIIRCLDDPEQEIQWTAREVLETFGAQALPDLIRSLADGSTQVRELSASLLGDIGDISSVATLITALETDDWQVRFAVIEALGNINDPRAIPHITKMTDDPDTRVRAIASNILKSLKANHPAYRENLDINQGDIYWVQLANPDGSPGIPHPHVVVQDDVFNHSRIDSVIVCAITSNPQKISIPGNVLLNADEGNLPRQSVVEVAKVTAVQKSGLGEYIGSLSAQRVSQILDGMRFQQTAYSHRS